MNGVEYSHVKELSRGEVHNHFYTPNGEDMANTQHFVQLLVISDKIQKSRRPDALKPLVNQYKLIPFNDEDFVYTGSSKISGIFFDSFATPIRIKEKEHMIIFVKTAYNEEDTVPSSNKEEILNELKGLESVFN